MTKILIVDDNERYRKMFSILLKNYGYETIEACNGSEAVKIAKEYIPDLVLMDLKMPVMNGINAFKMMKSEQCTAKIPVIALTSIAAKDERKKFINEGFAECISKPINVWKFMKLVDKLIHFYKQRNA
ncbi:MAG: response regulator [Nitrospira sp.]|nr:response regulator [Nitrospira sp.]